MEKSMIQDLDGMRTSLGYRNTFTTSFHEGGYQLKKSKISNLPSHKKTDLSVKLPFVIVFQTMQIQRLSQQIEALRVALKDSQRQAFNCQSYEVQIRQLTDQCHEYDVQVMEYKEQIEKLNMISQKLYQQLEDWKQKYQNFDPMMAQKYNSKVQQCQNLDNQVLKWRDRYRALEKSKDKQLQDLKLSMQSQRKSVLDRQIRQLNIKFQTQRSYLLNQLKKMQQAADQRDSQLTKVKYQAQSLRIQNQVNLDASRKLKQSQNKMNKLTEQLVRINELLRRKQEQIQRKDANQDYLKELIKSLQREKMVHQNQSIKVPQLQGNIKQWILRFARLQSQHNQSKDLLSRIPMLQNNLQSCTVEIERLGTIIKAKIMQINQLNMKTQKFKSLYEQSKKSQQKVPSLQRKITQMGYQAQRLTDMLRKRLIQVQQSKSRILVLEKALRAFEQAEPQKRRTQQQLKKQVREVEKYKKQIKQLQKEVRKIPEIQAVLQQQRNLKQQYNKQVDRLNRLVKDRTDECDTLSQKICYLENKLTDLSNIQGELRNYKNQNNRMVQQIDLMNNKIRQKCQQLQILANSIQNLERNLQHYKKVEQKLVQNIQNTQKIIAQLNSTKNDLQKTQKQLLQCQSQLNQAKNTIIQINNDKQILNRNLNLKNQQLERMNIEINECLSTIQQLRQIQRCYHALQQQMRITKLKLKQIEEQFKKQRIRNQELQYKNQMLMGQIQKIRVNGYFPEQFRMVFEQVKINSLRKDKQIQKLLQRQNSMQKFTDQIQGGIFNICQTMKVKNKQWLQINKKIAESSNNINKISQLQNQCNNLRDQNLELQSQIKMLNIQILELQIKKSTSSYTQQNINAPPPTMTASSSSSWSFNSVPSKKAIDSIVEDHSTSRVSNLSNNNHKRVLSSTQNIQMHSTSRSKLQQAKASIFNTINSNRMRNQQSKLFATATNSTSKYSTEQVRRSSIKTPGINLNINLNTNSASNYQLNQSPSSASINSSRGLGNPSNANINSYISPSKTITSTVKQSNESYYTNKVSKTSSVRQPFTLRSPYRA